MQRIVLPLVFLAYTYAFIGCNAADENDAQAKRVRPAVDLPPVPPLELPAAKPLNEDGSYTVEGLLRSGAENFGKGIRVSGIVVEKHTCTTAQAGTLCPPPYLVLVDSLENPRAQLMVVGQEQNFSTTEEGEPEIISGRFQQWSADKFYVRSEGLVEVPPLVEGDAVD